MNTAALCCLYRGQKGQRGSQKVFATANCVMSLDVLQAEGCWNQKFQNARRVAQNYGTLARVLRPKKASDGGNINLTCRGKRTLLPTLSAQKSLAAQERRAPHYGAMLMRAGRLLIGLEFKIQPSDWSKGHLPHSGNKGK